MDRAERAWERAFGWKRLREARRALKRFEPELHQARTILDLGTGRGYLAHALMEDTTIDLVCCDVVDSTVRPLERYCLFNGLDLPFRDHAFGAVLLAFVLHHAQDPVHLLREARRVCDGPIFVLEDTPTTWFDHAWGEVHVKSFNERNDIEWEGMVRRSEEWRVLFERAGLRIRRGQRLRRWERLPPVCRTAFVLEPD